MEGHLVQADALQHAVGLVEDGAAGGLIHAAALHAHQTVLHDVDDADAVGAAQLVELQDDVLGAELLAIQGHGYALLKVQRHIGGHIRGLQGGDAHFQKAGLFVLGLVAGVLQVQTLMGQVPQVLVLGVVGLPVDLQRHIVGLGVFDLFLTGLDAPLTPGGDDGHVGGKVLDGQLEADLVVALAGAAVDDGVGPFLDGDVHQALGDAGAGGAGAQQVVLIHGAGLHGGDDEVVHIFLGEVQHIELGSAGLDGLLLQPLQLVGLTHVAGDGDDLAVIVILFQPGDDDGCIQTARVGENDFFDIGFIHDGFPPCVVFFVMGRL